MAKEEARELSRAARRLQKALEPRMSQADLATKLSVTQQAVSAWVHGTSLPTLRRMLEIERLLGIPVAWWAEVNVPKRDVRRTGTEG